MRKIISALMKGTHMSFKSFSTTQDATNKNPADDKTKGAPAAVQPTSAAEKASDTDSAKTKS